MSPDCATSERIGSILTACVLEHPEPPEDGLGLAAQPGSRAFIRAPSQAFMVYGGELDSKPQPTRLGTDSYFGLVVKST
jgi:hypothetical protein